MRAFSGSALAILVVLALGACEAAGDSEVFQGDSVLVGEDVTSVGDGGVGADTTAPGDADVASSADGVEGDTPPPVDGAPGDGPHADVCAPDCEDKECGDDGCGGLCGACPDGLSCSAKFICVCMPDCEDKQCGHDGCDGTCGACDDGQQCDAETGQCVCQPDCDGKECGDDGCGGECGSCPEAAPYCYDNKCNVDCVPQCDGKSCGDDTCGGSCGDCADNEACDDAGQCQCVPACEGADCGDDGCGGDCGTCDDGFQCQEQSCVDCACGEVECGPGPCGDSCGECGDGLVCLDGACSEQCVPDCSETECGDDGCGGSCGSCGFGSACSEGACVSQCDLFCADKQCGDDTCGGSCGECAEEEFCNAAGQCKPIGECTPICEAVECGPDGCGGSCGECADGLNCVLGACGEACFDPVGCDGKSCGADECGESCGTCVPGLPCGFGGVCNACAACGFTEADCLDLNVEDGGLLGWVLEGDARVVSHLGETLPLEGDKMLLLSTGLGFTTQVGEATFANCLPEGDWHLAFKYKFFSEELTEYCGSLYQDGLIVEAYSALEQEDAEISTELYSVYVNDVCAPTDGSCGPDECGSKYVGLQPSDVAFDQGGVFHTPWVEVIVPLSEVVSGDTFTVKFHATDIGDSIYDTVILLDDVSILECVPSCDGATCGGDGCGGSCGSCEDGEVCDSGACCVPQCEGLECGGDGCGGLCGVCAEGDLCEPAEGGGAQCVTDPCADFECGEGLDGADCGVCADEAICVEGGCCTPECGDSECGDDGCGGSCGLCDEGDTCEPDGAGANVCSEGPCGPQDCGFIKVDGVPTDVECFCANEDAVCLLGEGAEANTCCVPQCDGKGCGDDGCGGSCGTCEEGSTCIENIGACCEPSCDGGAVCGPDGCGSSCGTCDAGFACSEGACIDTSCEGIECGPNAAGLSCGVCGEPPNACVDGQCVCLPNCPDDQACGADGCGGLCGVCEDGDICTGTECCTPSCENSQCGDDGCGGSCGECDDSDACTTDACLGGVCAFEPVEDPTCCNEDTDCDDDSLCTLDTCSPSSVCSNEPIQDCCEPDDPACCLADAECDDGDGCTVDACVANTCSNEPTDCCLSNEDCDDENDCTQDTCTDGACSYEVLEEACCDPAPASYDFETYEGITFSGGLGACGWNLMESPLATSGSSLLYYGDPEALNFDCGDQQASALSPPISLSAGVGHELRFDLRMSTESGGTYDQLWVVVVLEDGTEEIIWQKDGTEQTETLETKAVAISGLAGKTFSLRFDFDTIDGAVNGLEGVFIDHVRVVSGCVAAQCQADADCDDLQACTADTCVEGTCTTAPIDGCCEDDFSCDDDNECTQDACVDNACSNDPIEGCCLEDADCDDDGVCTVDSCVDNTCQNAWTEGCCQEDANCADGDICTTDSCPVPGESCVNELQELCCEGVDDCDDGVACTIDQCTNNLCSYVDACCETVDGCDDDDACTVDSCVEGQCQHESLCCVPDPATYNFEGETNFSFSGGLGECGWSVIESPLATTGGSLLYYGNPAAMNFDCGDQQASALSPAISLSEGVGHELRFDLRMSTESGGTYDQLWVYVVLQDGTEELVWQKDGTEQTETLETKTIAISGLAGETFSLRFDFDTVDGAVNSAQGVFIDHIRVVSGCLAEVCEANEDCDDLLDCTSETCVDGACNAAPIADCCEADFACDDDNACTQDACVDNACSNAPIEGCCLEDADCDDDGLCTVDSCVDNLCQNPWTDGCCEEDANCADGDVCTTDVCPVPGESCQNVVQELCCEGALDCDDGIDCTVDQCTNNICNYVDACCDTSEDCDDGDACSEDTCQDGQCQHLWSEAPECCNPGPATFDFEGESVFAFSGGLGACAWSVMESPLATSGGSLLYYGNPAAMNFDCGDQEAKALSPEFFVSSGVGHELQFDLRMSTESGGTYDQLWVVALLDDGTEQIVWQKDGTEQTELLETKTAPLPDVGGQTLAIRFDFDTVDGAANSGEGVFIDHIRVVSGCTGGECESDDDCNDLQACTADTCDNGLCVSSPIAGCCDSDLGCDDGNECTEDACVDNVCVNTAIDGCCLADIDCDDGGLCTEDSCVDGVCSNALLEGCCEEDANCTDGDVCTSDSCPIPGGTCVNEAVEACCTSSAACDDGVACTLDVCQDNSCVIVDNCCSSDADCNDGDDCSVDACDEGVCVSDWLDDGACCNPEPVSWTFEEPVLLETSATVPPCGWHVIATDQAQSGDHALYYGDPGANNFACGDNAGDAYTPWFDLPTPGHAYTLTFKLAMFTEASTVYDQLSVWAQLDDGNEVLLWNKTSLVAANVWSDVEANLSAVGGSTIRLRFAFDSIDAIANDTQGVFIDDIVIASTCGPTACESNTTCDDGFPWSLDTCENGECAYASE